MSKSDKPTTEAEHLLREHLKAARQHAQAAVGHVAEAERIFRELLPKKKAKD